MGTEKTNKLGTMGKLALRALAGLVVLLPGGASACAVCYGEPDSPAARGLTWAILALGVVVAVVISGVVMFFVQANRRALDNEDSSQREVS